jgi:hypothetical protein
MFSQVAVFTADVAHGFPHVPLTTSLSQFPQLMSFLSGNLFEQRLRVRALRPLVLNSKKLFDLSLQLRIGYLFHQSVFEALAARRNLAHRAL